MAELRRRLVHASGVVIPLSYLLGVVSYRQLGLLLLAGSAIVVGLELLRLRTDSVPGPLAALFSALTRPYEQDGVAGYALYVFSMTLVALVFPPIAAIPGMLMLALADPVGGVLGSAGPGERKRLPVLVVTFLVAMGLALAAMWAIDPAATPWVRVLAAAVGALAATLADGYTIVVFDRVVDDNATIPPAAAVGIAAVLWLV